QAGSRLRLAPEALHELGVLGEAAVEDLQRHLPAEVRVLGAVHVRHAARPQPVEHPVAAVDHRVGGDLGHPDACNRFSITCLAIGAATWPPCPVVFSTT